MNVRVEVVCVNAEGGGQRRRVLTIERRELAIETLNRSLTEGKIAAGRRIERLRVCPHCDKRTLETRP